MENRPRRIGLLLVHGMGEQRRLEHLRGSARELASFIARVPGLARVSFDDRTYEAPEEVIVDAVLKHQGEEQEERVQLCLREVFWADLGIGGGLVEQVKFWLWGLGQWAGEAVLKGDPLANTEQLMAMPRFGHQQSPTERPGFWRGLPGRLMLFGAALLAILTFFTWSAAKRLVSLIARRLPEPSLIFLFLGDVKIYERPGGPGKGTLLDPDMPMRATIRRRMVSAMTAMAAGGFDDWYIFAHSLGTIPAFNALQETEWALPNYLTEAEWQALPGRFKTQEPFTPPCARPTTKRMMPRRPPWLEPTDGVDRRRLFERFAGFVTYGSPLDKFAALWPRVVCLNRQAAVFPPRSEWINLHDPTDPVAARLDAFAPPQNREDPEVVDRIALEPRNFACRASAIFGLSHIRYFRPRPNGPRTMASALAGALVSSGRIPLSKAAKRASIGGAEAWLRMAAAIVQVAALGLLLTLAGSLLLTGIAEILPFGLGDRIERAIDAMAGRLPDWLPRPDWPGGADWEHVYAAGALILALAVGAIIIAGIARVAADIVRIARERKAKR